MAAPSMKLGFQDQRTNERKVFNDSWMEFVGTSSLYNPCSRIKKVRTNYLTSGLSSFLFLFLKPNIINYSGTDDYTHPPELFELPVFCEGT